MANPQAGNLHQELSSLTEDEELYNPPISLGEYFESAFNLFEVSGGGVRSIHRNSMSGGLIVQTRNSLPIYIRLSRDSIYYLVLSFTCRNYHTGEDLSASTFLGKEANSDLIAAIEHLISTSLTQECFGEFEIGGHTYEVHFQTFGRMPPFRGA